MTDKKAQQGKETLQAWLDRWELTPSDGAKVLDYSKSKISEILSDKVNKPLPPYLESHIETFNLLSNVKAKSRITKMLKKK
jgi:hypothetical protein